MPGETNQPQSEDDRLVIRGEDPRLRREIRGLFYPPAIPLLTSGVLPGNVHDLTARENVLAAIPIKAQVTASASRSRSQPGSKNWTSIPGLPTRCSAQRDTPANAPREYTVICYRVTAP